MHACSIQVLVQAGMLNTHPMPCVVNVFGHTTGGARFSTHTGSTLVTWAKPFPVEAVYFC